jgi:hypothetical protein
MSSTSTLLKVHLTAGRVHLAGHTVGVGAGVAGLVMSGM